MLFVLSLVLRGTHLLYFYFRILQEPLRREAEGEGGGGEGGAGGRGGGEAKGGGEGEEEGEQGQAEKCQHVQRSEGR